MAVSGAASDEFFCRNWPAKELHAHMSSTARTGRRYMSFCYNRFYVLLQPVKHLLDPVTFLELKGSHKVISY